MTSNLSAFNFIQERSEATPGLWNNPFSVLSANIAAVDSNVTFTFPSIETLSLFTNLDASGNLHAAGRIGLGPTPSAVTTGMLTIAVSSALSDYIHFEDTSGARSNYLLGSRVGGTADGLNLWDLSGDTMIASFSKQSVRFYQNVVGPVFDVGGALADTLNAATFGTGADSDESRIQAAISAATNAVPVISRVYIPASMYPYSAASISFETRAQMVREGGAQTVYDVKAYGATGDGSVDDYHAVQQAFNAAAANLGVAYIPQGRFRILSRITMPSNLEVTGAGNNAILFFNWFFASGATSGGDVYLVNSNMPAGSANTAIRLHDFSIEGDNASGLASGAAPVPAGGVLFRKGTDIDVARMRISNIPGISIAHQGISNARFLNNYVLGGGRDGITGGSFDTFPSNDVVVENNVIGPVGDDGIAINKSVDQGFPGTTRPARVSIVGNTIYGAVTFVANTAGRGVYLAGVENVAVVGNSIGSTFADGVLLVADEVDLTRSQFVTITGNTISGAGLSGDGSQSPSGIEIEGTDYGIVGNNVVSLSSGAGVALRNSTHIGIGGNSVISNGKVITAFGIDCSSSTNSFVEIVGNVVTGNAGAGIFLDKASECAVANNIVVNNGSVGTGALVEGAGILMQSRAYGVKIVHNTITDTRAAASKTQSWGIRGVSVSLATLYLTGNHVSGNSGQGILLTGTPQSLWMYGNDDSETPSPNVVGWWSPSAFTAGTALLPGMSFASEVSLGWFRSGISSMALSYGTLTVNGLFRVASTVAILPTGRILSGSGNDAQFAVGRTGIDSHIFATNTNNGFASGTRVGDAGLLSASGTTLHLGAGSAVPQLSLTSKGGRGVVNFRQSGAVSIRTVATSLDSSTLTAGEMAFTIIASGATLALHSGNTIYFFTSSASTLG